MIPEEARAEAHLRIGRLLAAHTRPEKREDSIFEIVHQLNRGAALITSPDEREQLAELNLSAGKRAKASTAYAAALKYLTSGAVLLPDSCWERQHELAFSLEINRAEGEFLTGELVAAEERLVALSTRAADMVERAAVTCLRIDLYTTLGDSRRAVAVCLDYLRHLGIDWSPHPTEEEVRREYDRIWSTLGSRTIEELVDLPLMNDPASLGTLDVLTRVGPPAIFTDANLFALTNCRAVNLSLERGNSDGSCAPYVWLGGVAGAHFGNYKAGFRFGRLGYELVERRGLKRFQAPTYLSFAGIVVPWTKDVRTCRDLLHRAFEIANKSGDLTMAGICCYYLNSNLLAAGDPLDEVQCEMENGLAFAQKARFGLVIDIITAQLALVRTLRGLNPNFGSFDDGQFDELRLERHFASNPNLARAECWYWIRKLQARFFADDYASAVDASLRAQHLLWTSVSRFETAEYHFYAALSRAASCASAAAGERQQHLDALAAHHRQLEAWSENCPENFENRVALVGAELARLEGRELDAEQLYEQAIRSAQANSFVHNEALANELASRFYAARGLEKIARLLLQDARYCYLRWGADGKVRQLEEMYPHLRTTEETAPGPTSTIASPVERLDLATIIKVSQAVSGEMVLEKLIDTLMRTAIEQAGAERGLLILLQAAEPQIEAEATTSGDTVSVQLRDAPVTASVLPETVLHYVMHTRESVILDDAATQPSFAADPYVRQRQARSILCLPLINQGKLIGALYLENNLTPRAFAPARSAVLKLLASQAATSLENTRLYRNLEHREAKIRGLVDANIIGICVVESDRRILEANDAYLRIIGYDRDDLLSGRISWTDLTPPEWRDRSAQAVSELTTTGAVQPFEKEYIRKDGSRVPVLVGAAGIEGTECQHVAFVLDLTERERAEAELRASEELKRRIIESSRDCIKVLDLDGNLLFMSSSGGQQLLEIDDIQPYLNSCWIDFWQPEDRPKISEAVAAARAGGIGNFQAFCPSAKGAPRWWEVIITPICNADGQPEQLLSVSRDITERKRAEAESRANERRYREMQTELAHANRVATMGQLTASIAHEVNQPLAAARINAASGLRFLSRNPPDLEEVGEALERVVKNADRGGEIIGRIRALIKKAPPRKDGVAINDAILEVVALTRGEATKNGVSVRTRLAEGLPIIEGDRVQLQQVILNLIVNAIEAMSEANEAPRELLISTGKTEPDAVFVAVQDTGPGLTPENLERLFDAFYTTKVDGMGMGLSICRSIIEAHGGRLWATANSPHGAIFQFTVPAFPAIHDHLRASWRGRH